MYRLIHVGFTAGLVLSLAACAHGGKSITTVSDLLRFADALIRGDLLSTSSRDFVLTVAERAGDEEALGVLCAYRKPYGVIVVAEGDGPGINVVWAMNTETRQIAAAAVNLFGRWDENEYLIDVMLAAALTGR